jgi:hypothetical protein
MLRLYYVIVHQAPSDVVTEFLGDDINRCGYSSPPHLFGKTKMSDAVPLVITHLGC